MNIVEATGLSKRYRGTWALRDCCLAIPEGRVAALVGPNGSGKTTLLNITVGLIAPTTGRVTVLGTEPAGSAAARDDIAFVAQDAPLYPNVSVADMLRMTRYLNRRWDQRRAEQRLADLGIPLRRRTGKLSGSIAPPYSAARPCSRPPLWRCCSTGWPCAARSTSSAWAAVSNGTSTRRAPRAWPSSTASSAPGSAWSRYWSCSSR
ncbi:MAG: ATP-binding cassette domain-containing protein [Streptosporangiaceae bacterium]|nr:ATP-binding cassette domain-containing protein [Streptosporangiaceae bacterium]